ncbi:uncharacterized protein LOC128195475 isoform X2 [Vigna angularis]|uniref:uncharacterized protein LOC128195475 isoform X2 n=1 Tax=Phaseolus angularis TaxID=3914 RepID=UPI0022B51914|nr:uncharacterized protein LOC128195475 isoform X2 [Vigna angularis]XP_052729197.1 uncharacterized protein LOC128195475 isoform X2 [Vigna angularis]XP_052729198.1 uncharacterized protein LOC128195475 isoform X2 [Vigna angularis]
MLQKQPKSLVFIHSVNVTEILSQLRELIKLELDLFHGEVDAAEPQKQFENLSTGFERDIETNMFPSYEINKPCRPLASGDYSFGTGLILMFDSGMRHLKFLEKNCFHVNKSSMVITFG